MYKNYLKRFFDFVAAFLGLLLLSPVFMVVTIGLFFANNGKLNWNFSVGNQIL